MTVQGYKAFINHTSRINPIADIYHIPFAITANQNITPDYHGAFLLFNSATPITVTLSTPSNTSAASSYNNGTDYTTPPVSFNGWEVEFKNIGAGTVTINTVSGTIDGVSSISVLTGVSGRIKSAIGSYYTIGLTTVGGGGGGSSNYAVVSSTIDTSAASHSQTISSLSFTPIGVRAKMGQGSPESKRVSFGASDGTSQWCMYLDGPNSNNWGLTSGYIVIVQDAAGTTQYLGTLSSLQAGGCTISWTKVGSPTGNVSVAFEFF